jgi:hypothetical protein
MRAEDNDVDRKRLAQLLGMVASDHDGEALNAARLADRHVRDRKMTWQSVLLDCFTAGYDEGFAAGKRASSGYAERTEAAHISMVSRCLEDLPDLTAKERSFLISLLGWEQLTPKQEKWLRDIHRRWELRRYSAS